MVSSKYSSPVPAAVMAHGMREGSKAAERSNRAQTLAILFGPSSGISERAPSSATKPSDIDSAGTSRAHAIVRTIRRQPRLFGK